MNLKLGMSIILLLFFSEINSQSWSCVSQINNQIDLDFQTFGGYIYDQDFEDNAINSNLHTEINLPPTSDLQHVTIKDLTLNNKKRKIYSFGSASLVMKLKNITLKNFSSLIIETDLPINLLPDIKVESNSKLIIKSKGNINVINNGVKTQIFIEDNSHVRLFSYLDINVGGKVVIYLGKQGRDENDHSSFKGFANDDFVFTGLVDFYQRSNGTFYIGGRDYIILGNGYEITKLTMQSDYGRSPGDHIQPAVCFVAGKEANFGPAWFKSDVKMTKDGISYSPSINLLSAFSSVGGKILVDVAKEGPNGLTQRIPNFCQPGFVNWNYDFNWTDNPCDSFDSPPCANNFVSTSALTKSRKDQGSLVDNIIDFKFYPNPSKEFIYLEVPKDNTIMNLNIYNGLGELVINKEGLTVGVHKIEINNIPPGQYFLNIIDKNGMKGTDLLIKQ